MRRLAFLVAAATALCATPADAFNARDASLSGLRLSMSEADLSTALNTQGFRVSRSGSTVSAKTRDGELVITLATDDRVRAIRYNLSQANVGARQGIMTSLTDRFGPPTRSDPIMWCESSAGMPCPPGQGTLTFWPDRLVLLLQIGTPTAP